MSNRTSEANKAIALAWAKEQQLIREGKGTRDWTPEQQQNILDRGKAYSDDGKAFQGHHMKSAERFPEYQGDPENIQFLSRPEHFAAHDGNFQNSTNGYFNPYTEVTSDFGSNKYEPCEIIELSEPIINTTGDQTQNTAENTSTSGSTSDELILPNISNSKKGGLSGTVKRLVGKGVKFYVRHKNVIDPVAIAVASVVTAVIKESLSGGSKNSNGHYENDDDYTIHSSSTDASGGNTTVSVQREDMIERSSPSEHTVKRHTQHYHTKDGIIEREKDPYPRGKKTDD